MDTGKRAVNFARALVTRTLWFDFERMPFRLNNVSYRKLFTITTQELRRHQANPSPPRYPIQLQIEPSSTCTLRCTLCPAGSGDTKGPRKLMSLDTFRAIIDEVGDYATIVVLWMWGEPFTNPALPEMITYAHKKNVAVVASTNGQHIQTSDDAEALVKSGLDNLVVALDGATQETYSQYRVGGDIKKLLNCLQLLRKAKDTLGGPTPLVNVRTVVNKYNEPELQEIASLAARYGADMVSRRTLTPIDHKRFELDGNYAPKDGRYRNFKHRDSYSTSCSTWRCFRAWNRMSVTAQGIVLPCEFDYNQTAVFGQGDSSGGFLAAWRSAAAARFRKQVMEDKSVFPFCRKCPCEWIRSGFESTTYMQKLTPDTLARTQA